MPTNRPQDNPVETPRGPTPAQDPGDNRNPNDPTLTPALMPIGDTAGAT
ncbi:hypothetical protein [Rhizobium sp. FY34]|nr:hypothetical protein [Rhizobium sp. FY34]